MLGYLKPDWASVKDWWPGAAISTFVTTQNLTWHVQRSAGTGAQRILLIHGTGSSAHTWRGSAEVLAQSGEVLNFDLPGHGFTETPPMRGMTLKGVRDLTCELLQAQAFEPDIIVGHSAGAAIALALVPKLARPPEVIVSLAGALFPYQGASSPFFQMLARMFALNPLIAPIAALRAGQTSGVRRLIRQTGSEIDPLGIDCYRALLGRSGHVSAVLHMMSQWDVRPLADILKSYGGQFIAVEPERDGAIPRGEGMKAAGMARSGAVKHWPSLGHLAHEEDPERLIRLFEEIL